MFRKISEAIQLLARHFVLLSALVLTVSIPLSLFINYLIYFVLDPFDASRGLQTAVWLEMIFRPIAIGAVIYALWQIKEGNSVSYGEAMEVGFRNWGRLFGARFVAGLMIGIGFFLFIVPGVVLALRWALLDCVVILEEENVGVARNRSEDLTEGVRLQILGLATMITVSFMVLNILVYFPIAAVETQFQLGIPATMAFETAVDSLLEVAYAVLGIVLFLFYWEKRELERGRDVLEYPYSPFEEDSFAENGRPPVVIQEDGNPYRPPQQ